MEVEELEDGLAAAVNGSARVTFEAGETIVLEDGCTLSPGNGGDVVARILP